MNNLAGVPSIVYGVFGLGFFAYLMGGSIDRMFFPERLRHRLSVQAACCGRLDARPAHRARGDRGH